MSRLSKWVAAQKKIEYNDFPSTWDYNKRFGLYEYIIRKEGLDKAINYLEFGVANGHSFNWWMTTNTHPASCFHWWMTQNLHPHSGFYGFDTFTGLPEDFGEFKKGYFDTGNNLPVIKDKRGQFFQGLFQQTLPGFLRTFDNSKKTVVMLDADLYTATLFTLFSLSTHLKKGDIILFDEFVVPTHEFKAYTDFINATYLDLELIGAANNYYFAGFKVR